MISRKYHNQPVTVGGRHFDSKAEARRYDELCLLHQRPWPCVDELGGCCESAPTELVHPSPPPAPPSTPRSTPHWLRRSVQQSCWRGPCLCARTRQGGMCSGCRGPCPRRAPVVQRAQRRPLPGALASGWDTTAHQRCARDAHVSLPFCGENHRFFRESGPFLGRSTGYMSVQRGGVRIGGFAADCPRRPPAAGAAYRSGDWNAIYRFAYRPVAARARKPRIRILSYTFLHIRETGCVRVLQRHFGHPWRTQPPNAGGLAPC